MSNQKLQALIVEDNLSLAEIFKEAMQMAGFETFQVHDGLEARMTITELRPVVVVLDLHLPNLDGEVILKEIRQNPTLQKTKIIVVSANSRQASYLTDLADFVLLKPISFRQLRDLATRLYPSLSKE